MGTDPDCDRMGAAARDASGRIVLLTGNETGSLLAYYRIRTMIEQGVITDANRERACLIKTFVTSELQAAIARHYRRQLRRTRSPASSSSPQAEEVRGSRAHANWPETTATCRPRPAARCALNIRVSS